MPPFFIGNSSSAIRNTLLEIHREEWLKSQLAYLADCNRHLNGLQKFSLPSTTYEEAIPFPPFASSKSVL